jgi:hypothetical protein
MGAGERPELSFARAPAPALPQRGREQTALREHS